MNIMPKKHKKTHKAASNSRNYPTDPITSLPFTHIPRSATPTSNFARARTLKALDRPSRINYNLRLAVARIKNAIVAPLLHRRAVKLRMGNISGALSRPRRLQLGRSAIVGFSTRDLRLMAHYPRPRARALSRLYHLDIVGVAANETIELARRPIIALRSDFPVLPGKPDLFETARFWENRIGTRLRSADFISELAL